MRNIPIAQPAIGAAEISAVNDVLSSGNLAQGNEVLEFENEFSKEAVQGALCVAVNSGTSALHLSLIAAGITSGDEVIVPSFTFAATANAIRLCGGKPVFADINLETFCIDPSHAETLITERTRAILPVHLYGHPAPMDRIQQLCDSRNLLIIEDAAQAHLASLNGKSVGTWGIAGAFSFYPTKNMTSGEGGMITTRSDEVRRVTRLLRNQGQERRYENEIVGFNNRMTDIHAAIGRSQLRCVREWTSKRQANATFYAESVRGVRLPLIQNGAEHVFHQYTIRVEDGRRDWLAKELGDRGIGTGLFYPIPVHELPAFREMSMNAELPNTRIAADTCLSIPVHPRVSAEEREFIAASINSLVGSE